MQILNRLLLTIFAGLLAGCGIPGVPSLPAPGAPPEPVPWPEADSAAMAAAAAPLPDAGHPFERDCFQRHLEEAIELNEHRRSIYAEWTDGASEDISRRLIASERQGLFAAWYVDRRARRYQAAGIPVVCAEFIPMSHTPPLEAGPAPPPDFPPPAGPDPDAIIARVQRAYGSGGFAAVFDAAIDELESLEGLPTYHCMVHHLLESLARTAALAPLHERAAETAGLPSPVPLSELLIRMHLAILHESAGLDRDAAPRQAQGVPIICRDVPPVPHPPARDHLY
jgi:hypothetical protein